MQTGWEVDICLTKGDSLQSLREEVEDLLAKVNRWNVEGVVDLLCKEVRTLEKKYGFKIGMMGNLL